MAGNQAAPMQERNSFGQVDSLLKVLQGGADMFKGASTTQTTRSDISQVGVNQLLQQILASNQGLGAVSGAQKSAGLYNSSTNSMLMNDLLTRAAGEVEARRAGTTTTSKRNPQMGASDILSMLGSAAGSSALGKVLKPTFKGLGDKMGLDGIGNSLADFFGLSGPGYSLSTSGIGTSGVATNAAGNIVGAGSASLDALAASGMTSSLGLDAGVSALGASFAPEALGLGASASAAGAGSAAAAAEIAASEALIASGGLELGTAAAAAGSTAAAAGTTAVVADTAAAAAGSSAFMTTLAEIGTWIASLFSDERLKTDITPVGKTNDGQNIYTYKYIDDPYKTHMGVLAQETLKTHPEAVSQHPIGALMVDYSKIS